MILGQGESFVNVHTEHKFKRKRRAGGVVDLVTEPENKRYRISFFKSRRMPDHSSVRLGYIRGLLEKYPTFFFIRTPDGS